MAWQKGPGEGYMAAKAATLAINSNLKCKLVTCIPHDGAKPQHVGYVVQDKAGKVVGRGIKARDAWGEAYFKIGGKFPIPNMER